ncbi:transcriptional regulator [Gracilibacillus oryzae]|uniref:Transcriptional regulator n=1 Tax=Gracilibacillus oryzae TaxID=1672701 RepID=A0A7C8KTT7_9BACI|nr:metalloregulator ArsR/SmtB family transcription factor [Gracilibacillus oryzae]KAB8129376.1 transcriptional regulator [Gracilibacillus oryzae]
MSKELTTREKILKLLKKYQSLSVSDIRNYISITEMAIRKHLTKLEADKLIDSKSVRQPMGRPVIYYKLTTAGESLFPKSYDVIVMDFLSDIEATMGEEAIEQLFENREKRMRKKYQRQIFEEDTIEEKVKTLVKVQNESGYMSEFQDEGEQTLAFSQYNCPIAAIASKYDAPCESEWNLFKTVLGTEKIERVECIAKGGNACKYIVKKRSDN